MNTMNVEVPSPGFFIKEELDARGWSQSDLAYILGMSVQQVNPILSGKRSISTEMAKALGDAFNVAPEFFSNLQTTYDHYRSREADPAIARRARLQEHFPIREMIRRGWFQDVEDIALLEGQVLRFFDKAKIDQMPYLAHAAKKTSYDEEISPSQYAWLYRVHKISQELRVKKFSREALKNAISSELPQLMVDPAEVRHVPEVLAKCGLRLVIVEVLPQAKIDGVCFWDKNQPVVGLSLRHNRIDNFWFVLRHELEHVMQGDGKDKEIIDDLDGEKAGEGPNLPKEERIANAAAAEFCTPRKELRLLMERKHPYLSEKDVLGFSRRIGIHPGIVVGQIQHAKEDYRFLRKYLVKIRNYLLPYTPHDGWGDVFPVEL